MGQAHRWKPEEGQEGQPDAEETGTSGAAPLGHGRSQEAGVVRQEDPREFKRLTVHGVLSIRHVKPIAAYCMVQSSMDFFLALMRIPLNKLNQCCTKYCPHRWVSGGSQISEIKKLLF